jgi:DNA mismatch repair protein MutL
MPILRLSTSVVNKIAAGEVIERPASVVKELAENSLDAGATRVEISVEQGGMELIRVADDGCGIPCEELPLAVASHATSKLRDADDLFRVHTFGFRGEALASISEISRFSLKSRTHTSDAGWELEVVGGVHAEPAPCGMSPGTTIEIRNLFYNTPVRRKFMRSAQTEMGHVTEAFTRLALAYPQVRFTLRHNDRIVYDLPAGQDVVQRIALFYGDDLARDLIAVDNRDGDIRLFGHVCKPSQSRSHPRMQYLFLNGRFIRDRSLQHALTESYRGLLLTGRYPITFLRFDMPADAVDVNVHPTKLEVRFQDGGRIYSQLLSTLRTKFLATDLTHRLEPAPAAKPSGADAASSAAANAATQFASAPGDDADASAHDPDQTARLRQDFVRWAQGDRTLAAPTGGIAANVAPWDLDDAPSNATSPLLASAPTGAPLGLHRVAPFRPYPDFGNAPQVRTAPRIEAAPVAADSIVDAPAPFEVGTVHGESLASAPEPAALYRDPLRAIQVHDKYLLAESDEGVLVIDQHALHERIIYEQLRAKINAGKLESQALLVPEPVDLPASEAAAVLEKSEVLLQLGIKVEPFGGDTILVSSYPAMLAKVPPAEILRSVVDQLIVDGKVPQRRDLLDELLHMISCKAAIKAGDPLKQEEVAALLAQRHLVRDTHHCPHGRPTALVFTKEELDKQFKRT